MDGQRTPQGVLGAGRSLPTHPGPLSPQLSLHLAQGLVLRPGGLFSLNSDVCSSSSFKSQLKGHLLRDLPHPRQSKMVTA